MFPFSFCGCNPLCLPLSDSNSFLFRNRSQYFNQNVVDKIENPSLILREFHERSRQIQHLYPDAMVAEEPQLILNIVFVAAQSIQGLDDQLSPVRSNVVLRA